MLDRSTRRASRKRTAHVLLLVTYSAFDSGDLQRRQTHHLSGAAREFDNCCDKRTEGVEIRYQKAIMRDFAVCAAVWVQRKTAASTVQARSSRPAIVIRVCRASWTFVQPSNFPCTRPFHPPRRPYGAGHLPREKILVSINTEQRESGSGDPVQHWPGSGAWLRGERFRTNPDRSPDCAHLSKHRTSMRLRMPLGHTPGAHHGGFRPTSTHTARLRTGERGGVA